MSHSTLLWGFSFGEQLDESTGRSLGYRLLAGADVKSWAPEVETLARHLQATPYPEPWPPVDLFGSVLLADLSRLLAVVRYGLVDHTPAQRRGGLEMVGVIGPGSLGVPSAWAIYQWLRQRRAETAVWHCLGGGFNLADVLNQAPPAWPPVETAIPRPERIWRDGTPLFLAAAPIDPDRHFGVLERGDLDGWQWLPLVGPDFPLATYAARGSLIAWLPSAANQSFTGAASS